MIAEIDKSINESTDRTIYSIEPLGLVINSLKNNYPKYRRFYQVLESHKGQAVINVLLTAAEDYQGIKEARSYVLNSDYKLDMIKSDDQNIANIVDALQFLLRKRKKNP